MIASQHSSISENSRYMIPHSMLMIAHVNLFMILVVITIAIQHSSISGISHYMIPSNRPMIAHVNLFTIKIVLTIASQHSDISEKRNDGTYN